MYVNTVTGQYPYSIGDFRRDKKNISFPRVISTQVLSNYGVYEVHEAEDPAYDLATQKIVVADQPSYEEETGRWVLTKSVEDMTQEEADSRSAEYASSARVKRNTLLAETDYLALTDNTLDDTTIAYRQALRDITSHVNFPFLNEEDWPVKPV